MVLRCFNPRQYQNFKDSAYVFPMHPAQPSFSSELHVLEGSILVAPFTADSYCAKLWPEEGVAKCFMGEICRTRCEAELSAETLPPSSRQSDRIVLNSQQQAAAKCPFGCKTGVQSR